MDKRREWRLCLKTAAVGGLLYTGIELWWRGRTHPSMFFVGGTCFELIGQIHRRVRAPFLVRCAVCAVAITAVELISGCILNRWLKLGVWDYSRKRFNFKGQVCLLYSAFWLALSAAALPIYALCRRRLSRARR